MLGDPALDAVLEVGSQETGVEVENHIFREALGLGPRYDVDWSFIYVTGE